MKFKKGMTWEDMYGIEKAQKIRKQFSERLKRNNPSKTLEVKEKLKLSKLGRNNPFYNKKHSFKSKKRMSINQKIRYKLHPITENTKEKMRENRKLQLLNPIFCQKMHEALCKSYTKERRKYMSENNVSKRPEVRVKISEKLYGKVFSIDTKKKMSISKKELFREHPEKHPNHNMKRISIPQRTLFSIVEKDFNDAILNHRIVTKKTGRWLDIALPKLKIDIEYDEPYWHKNKADDRKRDKELAEIGWKTIRFNKIQDENIMREMIKSNVDRIQSIECIGERTVGDLSMASNHNFVLKNGILVHNTETHI